MSILGERFFKLSNALFCYHLTPIQFVVYSFLVSSAGQKGNSSLVIRPAPIQAKHFLVLTPEHLERLVCMMAWFLHWADEGHMTAHGEVFDMGIATRKALMNFVHGTPAQECGGNGIYDNGNGSLMRILPVALYLHRTMGPEFPDEPEAHSMIHNASTLTHAHPISLIGCGIYCAVVNELLCGGSGPKDIQRGIA